MNAVTKIDGHGISSATVTNFSLDSSYYLDEEKFNKTADLLEMYFRVGGIQFQRNHLEKEDLIRAQKTPEDDTDLRVRVTGYSDYFNKLDKAIQDTVIARYDT